MKGKSRAWLVGRKASEETKRKMSETRKKIKRPTFTQEWKDNISKGKKGSTPWNKGAFSKEASENKKQRSSLEYRRWRKSVLERDDYTCIWCGSKENLEVDHIKPFAFFPQLRFAVENGRTLCRPCHEDTPTHGSKEVNIESVSNIRPNPLKGFARGVRKCAEIVGASMGPAGKNIVLQEKLEPQHQIINDGAILISRMQFKDELESMGHSFIREATERSNQNSGDGSSTTVVILNSLLQEGIKALKENNIPVMKLKEELDACLPIIEDSIKKQTREITVNEIPAVAKIAGENEELANVLGEIYKTIGKDGIIHLEGSGTYETSYNLIEGVRFFDTGYLSPYMAHDEKAEKEGRRATRAVYQKPAILVTKNKIEHFKDIDPILQALIASGQKTLVIFTDDMDSTVARALIELQKNEKRSINVLIIKAPTLWKGYVFEDFARVTGSVVIEDASGTSLGNKFQLDWLGTCDTLIVDKEETTIIGIKDISDHIEELTKENTSDSKLRLSWLTTKTAILKIGAKSETELSYLRYKAEDSIHSSRLALKSGIVCGGGVALFNAASEMPDTVGGRMLRVALKAPLKQIIKNAGYKTPEDNGFDGFLFTSATHGYDARTGKVVDMFKENIVDASLIVQGAIKNALGIASTLITTTAVILLPPKSDEPKAAQPVFF